MQEPNENQLSTLVGYIEEKGDLEHAIRCTQQALERADTSWLKRACAYRVRMLQMQLSKQKKHLVE